MPQTLDFVQECGQRSGVHVEYIPALPEKFEVVTHATPSRNGEPFERVHVNRGMLPKPVTRFRTAMLLCGRPHKSIIG